MAKQAQNKVDARGFRVLGPVQRRAFPVTCDNCGSGLTRKAVHATNAGGARVVLGHDCAETLLALEKAQRAE
jgi:hypothetical protein